jgi:hypothetical protein
MSTGREGPRSFGWRRYTALVAIELGLQATSIDLWPIPKKLVPEPLRES